MAFRLLEFTIAGQGDRKIIVSSRGVGGVHFQHGALGRNLTFVIFELFGGSAKFFLPEQPEGEYNSHIVYLYTVNQTVEAVKKIAYQ